MTLSKMIPTRKQPEHNSSQSMVRFHASDAASHPGLGDYEVDA
jgi:hypothetical protein